MEKKIPEKKVVMKESDVFYVYEKRINKCVKEGCEGVVKYGLIIKVGVNEEESINCFECNKCHMKYTPYPNYNRLVNKKLSTIYNAEEVAEWCERTQKKVENRNALKNKRTFARQDKKRNYDDKRLFDKKRTFGQGQERNQGRDGYQRYEGHQSRDGYQRREGYQNRDGYQKRESNQGRDGFRRREGNQGRDGYQRREGYQNRDGYQKREGYRNSYNSGYRSNTGKTFTVKKGNIVATGDRKKFSGKRPFTERKPFEENEK